MEFCANWIWRDPIGAKLLKTTGGVTAAVYNESDFIDYLNAWVFPEQHSKLIRQLDYYVGDELPRGYDGYPHFNF